MFRSSFAIICMSLCVLCASVSYAQVEGPTYTDYSQMPPMDAALLDDGAPINLEADGPAVIRLGEDASTVIVGNNAHANAMLENPRLIMLMPQQPGTTKIMALDSKGKAILNRRVFVGGGTPRTLRVSKPCHLSKNPEKCQASSMYYCEAGGRCFKTAEAQASSVSSASAPLPVAPPPAPVTEQLTTPVGGTSTPPLTLQNGPDVPVGMP